MPSKTAGTAGKTDTTATAQNRFVVSLPKDVGDMIDKVAAKLAKTLEAQTGVAFELSRAQVVQTLVRQALNHNANGDNENDADDDGDGDK